MITVAPAKMDSADGITGHPKRFALQSINFDCQTKISFLRQNGIPSHQLMPPFTLESIKTEYQHL
jgi:hypothetical protein